MKNLFNDEVVKKYSNIPLIVPAYASRKKEFYSVEDFLDFDWMTYYLGEVSDHESYITEKGMEFFKNEIGLSELAQKLFENKWYSDEYKSPEEIHEWLIIWEEESKKYSNFSPNNE